MRSILCSALALEVCGLPAAYPLYLVDEDAFLGPSFVDVVQELVVLRRDATEMLGLACTVPSER